MNVARLVLLSRELDRIEVEELTPQSKVLLQFSAGGHELAQVLLGLSLTHAHDAATVYYRSRPFLLACGLTAPTALTAALARTGSPTEGRDTGVLLSLPGNGGATVLPPSGAVGAQYTPATGWAQAIRYRQSVLGEKEWEGAIAVANGGDGSVATNGFWAALNIATTSRLPLLFSIENNGYAISAPAHVQTPGGNIARNLRAFEGLEVLEANGSDPVDSWNRVSEAVAHVRKGEGPCLLHFDIPRLNGHGFNDRQHYRSAEELEAEEARDPVPHLEKHLLSQGVSPEEYAALVDDVRSEVAQALVTAEGRPEPEATSVTHHLFSDGHVPDQGGLRREDALQPMGSPVPQPEGPRINFMDAVRRTLESELEVNPRAVVFGEDVGALGGVHRVTQGLQRSHGGERVIDTSLSEEGIMGRAHGMALAGLLPLPEIQFRKYADCAYEQISDIGTLRWRSAGKFAAPTVVRLPLGFSRRNGDPYHSLNGEAIYAHSLGWRIAFPSNAEDAVGLLRTAMRGDDPTMFLEHRFLLDSPGARRPYPGDDYCLPFGQAAEVTEGGELTVISWGEMVHRCVAAAGEFPGRVTVLDLRTICPWDREAVLASVQATGKALVVHEDTLTAGFAGEIIATIAGEAFLSLEAPLERVATPDCPVPYHPNLLNAAIPSVEVIREKMRDLLNY
ncbi:MAG: alpha-ketoacid dehydrogenase subunit alpha/beta [Planctomycetota bacterium]